MQWKVLILPYKKYFYMEIKKEVKKSKYGKNPIFITWN